MKEGKKYIQLGNRRGAINEAINKCLSAPFPQIAIHHLIDRLFETYEPDPQNPSLLRQKPLVSKEGRSG